MKDFQSLMLKNGIKHLVEENDDLFKKSLIDVLSLKLNENISVLSMETNKNLFKKKYKPTELSEEIKTFILFLEKYDPRKNAKIKLKNDSVLNITESQVKEIKRLFDSLNPKNRQLMAETIFESAASLEQHLNFYNKTKVLQK